MMLDQMDEFGLTGLHYAAENGDTKMLLLLLEKGALVNCKSEGGATPIHLAAKDAKTEAIQVLLVCLSICLTIKSPMAQK